MADTDDSGPDGDAMSPAVVQLHVEGGVAADDLSGRCLEACLQELVARIRHPERVTLVVTDDFDLSVKRWTSDELAAETFESVRSLGVVSAKALIVEDGGTCLVLRGEDLRRDGAVDELRFTVAHEAHHIRMGEESETLIDLRIRRGLDAERAEGFWCFLAGMCAEEFRVARALENEFRIEPGWSAHLPHMLEEARRIFAVAIELTADWSVDTAADRVLGAFRQLVTVLAYAVAEDLESDGSRGPDADGATWERMVGASYGELRTALAALPGANERRGTTVLDAAALALRLPLQTWLRHIGFTFDDRLAGPYFDILAHDF